MQWRNHLEMDTQSLHLVPRDKFDGASQQALSEIYACKVIFDKWSQHLDGPETNGPEFKSLKILLNKLQDAAEDSVIASVDIVKAHEEFAKIMVSRLEETISDPAGNLQYSWRALRLGEEIKSRSTALTFHVSKMLEDLQALVAMVRGLRRDEKEMGIWKKVCWWIGKALEVVKIVAASTSFRMFAPVIGKAASVLTEHENDDLNTLIDFLQRSVPREAKRAEKLLVGSQTSHSVMLLETELLSNGLKKKIDKKVAENALARWKEQEQCLRQVQVSRVSRTSSS